MRLRETIKRPSRYCDSEITAPSTSNRTQSRASRKANPSSAPPPITPDKGPEGSMAPPPLAPSPPSPTPSPTVSASSPAPRILAHAEAVEWKDLSDDVKFWIIYNFHYLEITFEDTISFLGLSTKDEMINQFIDVYENEKLRSIAIEENVQKSVTEGFEVLFKDGGDRELKITTDDVAKAKRYLEDCFSYRQLMDGEDLALTCDELEEIGGAFDEIRVEDPRYLWKDLDMGDLKLYRRHITHLNNLPTTGGFEAMLATARHAREVGADSEGFDQTLLQRAESLGNLKPSQSAAEPHPFFHATRKPGSLLDFAMKSAMEGKTFFRSIPAVNKKGDVDQGPLRRSMPMASSMLAGAGDRSAETGTGQGSQDARGGQVGGRGLGGLGGSGGSGGSGGPSRGRQGEEKHDEDPFWAP